MTRMKIGISTVSCLLLLGSVNQVEAGIVTWEMSGTIFGVSDSDNFLDGQISIGSPFSLTLSFDPDVPDSDTRDGGGLFENAILDYSGSVGPLNFEIHPGGLNSIMTGEFRGGGGAFSPLASVEFENTLATSFITLSFRVGFLDVNTLPILVPELSNFSDTGFDIESSSDSFRVLGAITEIVPEPTTSLLVFLGVSVLSGVRHFRRKRL